MLGLSQKWGQKDPKLIVAIILTTALMMMVQLANCDRREIPQTLFSNRLVLGDLVCQRSKQ